jgi:Arc/MetJ family transcription regulator
MSKKGASTSGKRLGPGVVTVVPVWFCGTCRPVAVRREVVCRRWMARTDADLDDDACRAFMERYHLSTKRDAVNFAVRTVAANRSILNRRARCADPAGRAISTSCAPVPFGDLD